MSFNQFTDKLMWGLMIAVAGYGSSQIENATRSINELNSKMTIVIERLGNQSKNLEDHEARLRRLESRR